MGRHRWIHKAGVVPTLKFRIGSAGCYVTVTSMSYSCTLHRLDQNMNSSVEALTTVFHLPPGRSIADYYTNLNGAYLAIMSLGFLLGLFAYYALVHNKGGFSKLFGYILIILIAFYLIAPGMVQSTKFVSDTFRLALGWLTSLK